jgi:hypothetical protein
VEFKSGDLAIFRIEPGIHFTEDGFTTILVHGKSLCIPENINLNTYPSCSDFTGKMTEVKDGDIVLILRFLGRPMQIVKDPDWFQYDVYSILINGNIGQAFKQNLGWTD